MFDDTEQIRHLIRVNLELEGYDVIEAHDGEEALEILRASPTPRTTRCPTSSPSTR